jgi:iron complex outermembrane receptor protein
MNSNPKLSYAIAAILSGSSAMTMVHAATEADTSDSEGIQEITVTAQRRTENMQDVPISIQAMTSETLKQLNVTTFDDFIKFVPNVSTAGTGPGQKQHFHARTERRRDGPTRHRHHRPHSERRGLSG